MNKVILIGRLTHSLEVKKTPKDESILASSIAVQRPYKNSNGEYDTDFINFVAYREKADFIAKYFTKGKPIILCGWWQVRQYQGKDGSNKTANELVVTDVEFPPLNTTSDTTQQAPQQKQTIPQPTKEEMGRKVVNFEYDDELGF